MDKAEIPRRYNKIEIETPLADHGLAAAAPAFSGATCKRLGRSRASPTTGKVGADTRQNQPD